MSSQTIEEHHLRNSLKWENLTIGKTIGTGTDGPCYSCFECTTQRVYAVKIIKFNSSSKAEKAQINNEIELLEGLSKYPFEKHLFPTFYGHVYYISHPLNEHFCALLFEKADGDL
mgnify:CR=1 FL=1